MTSPCCNAPVYPDPSCPDEVWMKCRQCGAHFEPEGFAVGDRVTQESRGSGTVLGFGYNGWVRVKFDAGANVLVRPRHLVCE